MLFGKRIFQTIGAPTLLFALAVMIAQAPIINGIGRIGAWAGLPGGIGPLLFVGHPLKTLNILLLLIVMIVLMVKLRKNTALSHHITRRKVAVPREAGKRDESSRGL
ncbi:hypothetical protein [Candidatus Hakubella thermalkaliphila]|uniref:hypothetical protein n=1 Tax=Candidatus Hakubella thermalkaliphila TaxID=2754717 RepID=UPI001592DB8C|nr:hypothetical protein [Candidatus Hakubella thermalkaliphila]MBT9167344.1 hypothetical protein [Bacillota bacterium]